jgi:hypothetical protein
MKLNNYAILSAIQSENYEAALEILMEHFGLSDAARAGVRLAIATRPDFLVVKKDKPYYMLALRFNYYALRTRYHRARCPTVQGCHRLPRNNS